MQRFLTFILFLLVAANSQAQPFEWLAGYNGFLDNREYFNPFQTPRTIFGSRLRAEVGGNLDQSHRLRAGLDLLYEFGSSVNAVEPALIMYYRYNRAHFNFFTGVFPRRHLLDYPLSLLNDTLNYYRPNIEGGYISWTGDWGYQDVFIDWTSRQTDVDFERFMFGFSGRKNIRDFYISHHFLMGHFAGPGIPLPGHHLRDNGGFDISLGLDLSDRSVLDTLVFSVGALVSLDRVRGVDAGWQTPAGMIAQAELRYRFAGIRTNLHAGEGHTFLYGDSFYRAGFYARMDMFLEPFRAEHVRSRIGFALHLVEGGILDTSQQILVSVDLGGSR